MRPGAGASCLAAGEMESVRYKHTDRGAARVDDDNRVNSSNLRRAQYGIITDGGSGVVCDR